jgi:hypothetical protein
LQLTRGGIVCAIIVLGFVGRARAQEPEPEPAQEPTPEPAPEPTPEPEQAPTPTPIPARQIDVHASSEVAGYADTDHVFVISPSIGARITNPTAGWNVGGRYLVDVVSAASVDIVATASQNWHEVRHVGSVDGGYKPGNTGVSAHVDVSSEPDYLSLNGGLSLTQDLFEKHLALLVGYSRGQDTAGRTGTPFSTFKHEIGIDSFKTGATIVLDRSTLLSVVGDAIFESGDSSKPYRYVAMFAPGTDVPKGASLVLVDQLRLSARPLEQLPLTRHRFALSGRIAHRFDGATLRVDERLYTDSWGLQASSTDSRAPVDLGSRVELGPHVRFHIQSPVDFWQRAYTMTGLVFPALRTGDRELGPLYSITGGGSLRIGVGPARDPRSWRIGVDLNGTWTRYLDDLFVTSRLSTIGALSLEADL